MPHRIAALSNVGLWIFDGFTLAIAGLWAVIDGITLGDLTGPHGLLMGALLVVGVLWKNGAARERNEEKRRAIEEEKREMRHKEMLAMQEKNSADILKITVESIAAHAAVAVALEKMAKKPCQLEL